MTAPPLVAPGAARRRAGGLLLAYGIAGVILMAILFVATLGVGVMGRDGFTQVDESIDEVVAVLDSTVAALRSADETLAGVGTSLGQTTAVVDEAVVLAGVLSDGAATLGDQAGSFGILGQQPFAGIVEPLRDAGASLDRLSVQLVTAGVALGDNAADVSTLASRLGSVADSLSATRDRLAAVDSGLGTTAMIAIGILLAIIAWLAVPAVVAIGVGRRWRAENPPA